MKLTQLTAAHEGNLALKDLVGTAERVEKLGQLVQFPTPVRRVEFPWDPREEFLERFRL